MHAEPARVTITGGLASLRVVRADGTVEEHLPAGPSPTWLRRAFTDSEVLRALRLRDANDLSWTELYRVFEIVCAAVGGEKVVSQRGWASTRELQRFSHSANSVAAAGDAARHGVENTEPPTDPMLLSDARALIDRLLAKWIEHGAA